MLRRWKRGEYWGTLRIPGAGICLSDEWYVLCGKCAMFSQLVMPKYYF